MRPVLLRILFFFLLTNYSLGQTFTAEIEKEEIALGEPVKLTFKVSSETQLTGLKYKAQLSNFNAIKANNSVNNTSNKEQYALEILTEFKDSNYKVNNTFYWEGTYLLTGWDSAMVVIPEESIWLKDSTYYFNTCALFVNSPVLIPTQPIQDIIELETALPADYWSLLIYCAVGLVILVALLLVRFWVKRKKPVLNLSTVSLKEATLKEISALEKSKLYLDDLKEYYFKLSVIMKGFLSKQYNETYTDKTTAEIKLQLKSQDLSPATITTLLFLLNQSDLVKFAKSKPNEVEINATTQKAKQIVHKVATVEITVTKK